MLQQFYWAVQPVSAISRGKVLHSYSQSAGRRRTAHQPNGRKMQGHSLGHGHRIAAGVPNSRSYSRATAAVFSLSAEKLSLSWHKSCCLHEILESAVASMVQLRHYAHTPCYCPQGCCGANKFHLQVTLLRKKTLKEPFKIRVTGDHIVPRSAERGRPS